MDPNHKSTISLSTSTTETDFFPNWRKTGLLMGWWICHDGILVKDVQGWFWAWVTFALCADFITYSLHDMLYVGYKIIKKIPWLSKESAAAAATKSLQSCLTLCDPIDGSPPGSPIPGILQARTPERVAISFSNAWKWRVKVKSLSRVWLFATPWTAAYQAPPSIGFSRQEYWSGSPLPSPIFTEYIFIEKKALV